MLNSNITTGNEAKELPIFVILGSTGTGKTQLSVDLALKIKNIGYYPHIISCDSAQIYRDFDIGSAKVTIDEQKNIPHHMIDIVDIDCVDYSLYRFQQEVSSLINKLRHNNDKVVLILVGGTNLYMESIVFSSTYSKMPKADRNFELQYSNVSNDDLYQNLKQVDPERAELLHSHDRKRILRSLEIYSLTGMPHSQILKMRETENLNLDFCFLWVSVDNEILYERLDNRVDKMIQLGLKEEIIKITRIIDERKCKFDFANGVQKCIGFKEFQPFIEACNYFRDHLFSENDDIFKICIDDVKRNTKRYAKSQIKWIKNRFLINSSYPIYKFDSSNINEWENNVLNPSWKIVFSLLTGNELDQNIKLNHLVEKHQKEKDAWKKYICNICNRELNGLNEWNNHLSSRSHRRKKKKSTGQPK